MIIFATQQNFSQNAVSSNAPPGYTGWLYHNYNLMLGSNTSPKSYLHIHNPADMGNPLPAFLQITNSYTFPGSGSGLKIGINTVATDFDAVFNQQENANIYFYTNNLPRVVIDNTGKTGIGITTPQHTLHVHGTGFGGSTGGGSGTASSSQGLITKTTNTGKTLIAGTINTIPYGAVQVTNTETGTSKTDGLLLGVSGNNGFIILNESGEFNINVNNHNSVKIHEDGKISISDYYPPDAQINILAKSVNALFIKNLNNPGGYGIKTLVNNSTVNAVEVATNTGTIFVVKGSGKVGICTSTPDAKLSFGGDLSISNKQIDLQQGYLIYSDNVGSGIGGATRLWFDAPDNGSIVFGPRATASLLDNIRIRADKTSFEGSVGIGTSTPDMNYKLDVRGAAHFCKVIVKSDGWCDYVFDNEYTIMPLDSLELYIKTNKHLPDIPSQAEVMENGIDIAKTNAKLLEKIEELTLYIIEQNKKINKLQRQIKNP